MIEASRFFVCVRPQTYESAEEAKVLSYVFAGRSGLENTSFALLDPKGKKITRGSRSPSMTFGSATKLAEALTETAAEYSEEAKEIEALPTVRNLRLALNVAAADMRPLIVIRGKDEKATAKLSAQVAKLSWSKDLVGRSHYVVLHEETTFEELTPEVGVSVIHPDPYGLGGEVLSFAKPSLSGVKLAKAIEAGLAKHQPESREHDDHVREARRKGIEWESEIPVTDKDAKREKRHRRKRGE